MKEPCIVISGLTATGKSELAVDLALKIGGSVISADSMQVYRGMEIGSAQLTKEEMRGIPHYLTGILDPKEGWNVVRFQKMAKQAMREIRDAERIPIVTGGTGFYIQALLKDIDFSRTGEDSSYRKKLEYLAKEKGPEYLHGILEKRDPESAAAIHPNNVKRVIRALEYQKETGVPISVHNAKQRRQASPYDFLWYVVTDERRIVYRRIDDRVDRMMERGLLEEAERLVQSGLTENDISMKGLGFREWFPYFRGEISKEETVRRIKLDTRHYAKRQETWFRRERDVTWINRSRFQNSNERILNYLERDWETFCLRRAGNSGQ